MKKKIVTIDDCKLEIAALEQHILTLQDLAGEAYASGYIQSGGSRDLWEFFYNTSEVREQVDKLQELLVHRRRGAGTEHSFKLEEGPCTPS